MKNKNRPFFYEKKKTSAGKLFAAILLILAVMIYAGFQVPGIRQIISEPLFAAWSLIWNGSKTFIEKTRMYHEPEKKKKTYEILELPDQQVLFAESLENLSALSVEDPLADLRQTPTPSEYSRVADWEYKDPSLNYAISSDGRSLDEDLTLQMIPPVFEHADLYNDGAAILSACFRYWKVIENQYQIAWAIHPDSLDPFISFDDLEKYVHTVHPDFSLIKRLNGDKDVLISFLERNIPVIILIQEKIPYTFWLYDDRLAGKYLLILGYDSNRSVFTYQDSSKGNALEINESDLMAAWYPFQRQYMALYPEDMDEDVRSALSENYYEELNLQKAMSKFRVDSEMLPENPYAQYNCAVMLHLDGDNGGAWELFQKALGLSLPQRFFIYQSDMLQTALEMGYADDLEEMAAGILDRNVRDEVLTVYRGWSEILRGDYKKGSDYFEKAKKINPNSNIVLYALKYRDTMLNY